jgi:hypothetical protein
MDHCVAIADVSIELVQGLSSGRDEILLDVHGNVRPLEEAAEHVAITAKLVADGRKKQMDVGHNPDDNYSTFGR